MSIDENNPLRDLNRLDKTLYKKLNIDLNKKEVISFVGGGGKTTTMFDLAEELKALNKKVLVTTTTHIFAPDKDKFDNIFLKDIKENKINSSTITILGEKIINNKLKGLDILSLEKIIGKDLFDYYLIEADGAKGMPIKAPDYYEPVITDSTTKTIGLIGLDALDKTISEISHRKDLLLSLLEKESFDRVEIKDIIKLVLHKYGLFKYSNGETILLLNKAIDKKRIEKAKLIRESLAKQGFKFVIIADVLSKNFY